MVGSSLLLPCNIECDVEHFLYSFKVGMIKLLIVFLAVDGYFELACSPAVRLGGRNKEYAHHILHKLGGSVKVCSLLHTCMCSTYLCYRKL